MLSMIAGLMGGLGLFLYGMKMMGDGLERVAGDRMRRLLEILTKNRLMGILVGAAFTMIIQSSSATTVMVVGFVNAGLMDLLQASGVIMGANFGTSITAQLAAFKLSEIAPVILLGGVVMFMFIKRPTVQKIGIVLAGFGILFVGMDMMSEAMGPMRTNETFIRMIHIAASTPVTAMLIGVVVTCIIQSSSASVVLTQLLAAQGLVTLDMAIYISLGCAIGTCITAVLASVGTTPTARRAAMIHLLYNVIGSTIMLIALQFIPLADWMRAVSGGDIKREIANANMLIKLVEIVVLFGAAPLLVRMSGALVHEEDKPDEDVERRVNFLDPRMLATPSIAVAQAVKETERMGQIAVENMERSMRAFIDQDSGRAAEVAQHEDTINFLNHEITTYLIQIGQQDITGSDAALVGSLYHVINDIERIGDHAENMAEFAQARIRDGIPFSEQGISELEDMWGRVLQLLTLSRDIFHTRTREHLADALELEDEIDDMEKELQQSHIDRLSKGLCTPRSGMLFSDILSNLERVADHATNIAFSIATDEPPEVPKDWSMH